MGIKLLHTADWHVGDGFKSIGGEAATFLSRERLEVVERIARLAADSHVDAVLVAGDIFDFNVGNGTFHKLIDAMKGFRGDWVLIPGNHDFAGPGSVWTRLESLTVPANIHCVVKPGELSLKDGQIHILCAPLQHRHESRDVTAGWPSIPTSTNAFRIGLAHGGVPEMLPPETPIENRVPKDRAATAKLDYLALGDWHGLLNVNERTWYPGTPEPESFTQPNAGNVLLVSLEEPGALPKVDVLPTAGYKWRALDVVVNGVEDVKALEEQFKALGAAKAQVVKVTVGGSVDIATRTALDVLLDKWTELFCHLAADLSSLAMTATPEDISRIGATGFLADAIARLQTIAADPHNPDSQFAPDALQLIYRYAGGAQ